LREGLKQDDWREIAIELKYTMHTIIQFIIILVTLH